MIDNRTLVDEYIVHNAYTNNTHAVFGLPKLKLVQQLLVKNTLNVLVVIKRMIISTAFVCCQPLLRL